MRIIIFISLLGFLLSGCVPISFNSIENFKGSVVVEKKIYKNQLGEPISYIYTIRETVNGRRGPSYRIVSFEVVEYEYDLYNVGDTIKQWIMKTLTIQVPDGCEVQIVRKEEKKESVIRTYQDLISTEKSIKGFYLGTNGGLIPCATTASEFCTNTAASEKAAKSMLAMAMISQLMPYYGGEVTDEELGNSSIYKYVIRKSGDKIATGISYTTYYFLAFHTEEQRDNFLKWNLDLVKDYLMID